MRTDSLSLGIEFKPDENQIRLLNPSPPSFLDMVVLRDLRPAEGFATRLIRSLVELRIKARLGTATRMVFALSASAIQAFWCDPKNRSKNCRRR